ncbi:hypothetical protein PSPO01_09064 [Paraphaeosphaeria sporulosa]
MSAKTSSEKNQEQGPAPAYDDGNVGGGSNTNCRNCVDLAGVCTFGEKPDKELDVRRVPTARDWSMSIARLVSIAEREGSWDGW